MARHPDDPVAVEMGGEYPTKFTAQDGTVVKVAKAGFWADRKNWEWHPPTWRWGMYVVGETATRFVPGQAYVIEFTYPLHKKVRRAKVKCTTVDSASGSERADFERASDYVEVKLLDDVPEPNGEVEQTPTHGNSQ